MCVLCLSAPPLHLTCVTNQSFGRSVTDATYDVSGRCQFAFLIGAQIATQERKSQYVGTGAM